MEQDKMIYPDAQAAIELLEDTLEELRNHPDRLVSGTEWVDYDPIMINGEVESYVPQSYRIEIIMKPMEQS